MRLYTDLADWWHLMSAPEDYAEEAGWFAAALAEAAGGPLRTVLELGSGGGNNASHLKVRYAMTLAEPAPGMRAVSERLNPECEHVAGDMRDLRLGRAFDAVFVHDAIMYMTSEEDLRRALATAAAHCRRGGVVLVVPDATRETWQAETGTGGHDGDGRGMRYLQWAFDPDPGDTRFTTVFAFLLRDRDGTVRHEADEHEMGLFARATWLRLLGEAGLAARSVPLPDDREMFVARRP